MAKKKPSKGSKVSSGRPKKPARKAAKKAEKKPAKTPKKTPVVKASGRPGGRISFICSECYEEFLLTTRKMGDTVTCPECLHVGKKPAADFLNTVELHKGGEFKSLFLACFVCALLLLFGMAIIWIQSPYGSAFAEDSTLKLGLAGMAGIFFLVAIWAVIRYEKNRWEVYF